MPGPASLPDWVCALLIFALPVVMFWMFGETVNEAIGEAFEAVLRAEKRFHQERR